MPAVDPLIHIPDRLFEGYGPNTEAIRALAESGAHAAGHGRLRHHQHRAAGGGARRSGSTWSIIDHHQADETLPPAVALVNPNRLDDLSGLGHLAAVGLVFMTVVAVNRELRKRGFWTSAAARAGPARLARPRGARHGRRRGAAEGAQPRLRRQGPDRDARGASMSGLTALMDVARLDRSAGTRGISASCSGRASMRAGASAAPTSACGCCSKTTPIEAGAHRGRARPAQPRAPGDRAGDAGAGRSRGDGRARHRGEGRGGGHRRGGLASRRRRAGRGAAEGDATAGRPSRSRSSRGGIGTGSGRSIAGVDLGRAVRHAVRDGLADQGRRPRHGGRRDAAQGRARAVPRLSRGRARPSRRGGAARGRRC